MNLTSICHFFGLALLTAAWLLPDHNPPWNTFLQEATAIAGMALLWPWGALKSWPIRIYTAAAIFVFALSLQFFYFKLELGDLLFGLLAAFFFCMAATIGHQQDSDISRLRALMSALLAGALISTVIGLAQWLHVTQGLFMLESSGRVYGNFAQPNHFATLLILGIGALIYLDSQRPLTGGLAYVASIILVIGLAASESRTGALSFTLMVVSVALIGRRKRTSATLRWLIPSQLLFWGMYASWQPLSQFMGTSATRSGVGLGTSSRLELWTQMVEAIRLQPWLGYGWMHLGSAQNAVAGYIGGTVNMDHAHNIFLDLMVWFGLPLGGVASICGTAWFFQAVRHTWHRNSSTEFFCFLLMLLPIGIHSLLEYPFAYLYFLIIAGYFAGSLEAQLGYSRVWSTSGRKVALLTAICMMLLSALIARDYFQIEQDYRALRFEQEFVTKKEYLHKFHTEAAWLTQYGKLIQTLRKDLQAPAESTSIESARQVTMRFPWLINYKNYYILLIKNGRCEEAEKELSVIKSLFRNFGVLKIEEEMENQGINNQCSETPTDPAPL